MHNYNERVLMIMDAACEQEIASEPSPEAVWRRAAELQRAVNPIGRPKKAQKDAEADGMVRLLLLNTVPVNPCE